MDNIDTSESYILSTLVAAEVETSNEDHDYAANVRGVLNILPTELKVYCGFGHWGVELRHPLLCFDIDSPNSVRAATTQLAGKTRLLEEAIGEGDYLGALCIHEKYARLKFVADLEADCAVPNGMYWQAFREAYTTKDWPSCEAKLIKKITKSRRGSRELVMFSEERKRLAALEVPLKIYRGGTTDWEARSPKGASWTLDVELARWFAWRNAYDGAEPVVWEATIKDLSRIVAFWNDRSEQEVLIVDPLRRALTEVRKMDVGVQSDHPHR
jgi:hypothetical protein